MTLPHHDADGPRPPAGIAVLTVSDTRTPQTDASGSAIRAMCEAAGHRIAESRIVPDEPGRIRDTVAELAARADVDAVIVTGGTGVSARDRTPEAVTPLFEMTLDGFGELFRALSFDQIGAGAMLSRAVAGVVGGRPVFCLPGSEKAVRLGVERLILPPLGHLLSQLRG